MGDRGREPAGDCSLEAGTARSGTGYNEFADAMRAFLERDRDELLAIHVRVLQYPPQGMTAVYQSVVESFVERFDGSYNDVMAYEAAKKK